ncbi:MAG: carboxylesterase [Ottowia sp.]|uniref:alpha/beta hydrolase n=1 Tax=Ottowia sp. TaxID=1898956 RepID=UPI0039E2850B
MPADPSVLEFETGASPRATVIVLHGLGADASDFAPFVHEVDLAPAGPVRWVFPNAPRLPVTINGGYVMPAWYDIHPDRNQEDEVGLRRAQASIDALLAREAARGVPAGRIVLGGFSQGCAVALLAGLRYPERLAGILGMSGYLPLAATLAAERSAASQRTPIFLAHGSQDDIVAPARAIASRDVLRSLGYAVEWRDYPMGHSVCLEEVRDLQAWLRLVLSE